MDTFGIKNYNATLQIAANTNASSSAQSVKNVEVDLSGASGKAVPQSYEIKDRVDTNPLFVITPDGTTHRKTQNELGETEYVPSITLASFKRSRLTV